MCIFNFGHERRWQTLYHATVEHFASGSGFDSAARQQIEDNNGQIPNTQLLRKIAKTFIVIRGIPSVSRDENAGATRLLGLLNDRIGQDWHNLGLVDKAHHCVALANHANEQGWTNGLHLSGVTKYLWFLWPWGWTMYDRFARRGLCIYEDDRSEALVEFYQKLEVRGFEDSAISISETIQGFNGELNWLYGERVIDKYLMIAGGAVESGPIRPVQEALNALDAEEADTAHAVAQAVANQHCNDHFFLPPQD
jgi:hypothetical protein